MNGLIMAGGGWVLERRAQVLWEGGGIVDNISVVGIYNEHNNCTGADTVIDNNIMQHIDW